MSEDGITGINEEVKNRLRTSWKNFSYKNSDLYELGIPMFVRLFEKVPEVKTLFHFDENAEDRFVKLKAHIKLLFDTIGFAIDMLDDLRELTPVIIDLGTRHFYYGVDQRYYLVFGECLVYAIETALNKEFSKKDKEAWMTFYHWIGGCIVKGICMESHRK